MWHLTLINLIILNLSKINLSYAELAITQFVSFSANLNIQDHLGYTSLYLAIDKSRVTKALQFRIAMW